MFRNHFLTIIVLMLTICTVNAKAQQPYPTIHPYALIFSTEDNEEKQLLPGGNEGEQFSAPVTVKLFAAPEDTEGYTASYEWRFFAGGGNPNAPMFKREGEEWSETITTTGSINVVLYAYFRDAQGNIVYEYGEGSDPISFIVKTSKLEFPNAFSPNGDGINDVYKAKEGYQSIIEFRARIYNRWGQKLYEWTDPAGGWDGRYNGSDVKQGVYYVLVEAKGADGMVYNIRRDVNLLRGYTEKENGIGN